MNIVLIGYRGTGKTAVGKKLAGKLNRRLIKTDEFIVEKFGMSIPEIVQNYGWKTFRDVESKVVEEISKMDNCIIDTGGGIILRKINVKKLKGKGITFLLKADVKTIINRIIEGRERPSLTGRKSFTEEVDEVLNERRKKYEEAADYSIDTSTLTVEEISDRIINYLKQKEALEG